jgi:alpha-tubulin suppressor-like RCC1 family protein
MEHAVRRTSRARWAQRRTWLITVVAALTLAMTQQAAAQPAGDRQPGPDVGWTSVSTGYGHACGTKEDGSLWCWGEDFFGDVGDGRPGQGAHIVPVSIGRARTWLVAAVGGEHSCAIATDLTLWCWGSNFDGELGDGSKVRQRYKPAPVVGAGQWASFALGSFFTCAIQTDGTLWCWGANEEGQLGDGTVQRHRTPRQVGDATDWTAVSAGPEQTCGIRSDQTLWCWGYNYNGQIGDGTRATRLSPVQIGSSQAWASVDTSGWDTQLAGSHSCASGMDGSLWCWGSPQYGQLGIGAKRDQLLPRRVGRRTDWTAVSVNERDSCASRTSGTLWCWGSNHTGELGDGTTQNRDRPAQVGPPRTWTTVAAGPEFTCGLRDDGSAWCWGSEYGGKLGNGEFEGQENLPVLVK